MQLVLTPELMIEAYKQGLFPMAYNAKSDFIHWVCPEERGQLSITDLHISKSLKKAVRKAPYEIKINTAFQSVIESCAAQAPERPETWINQTIIDIFCKLHERGHAHSIECWEDDKLVGGLYGMALGGAFCGESMFSRASNASKIALVHLVARLWKGGFTILDTQFVNDHLLQFGVYEIPHNEYKDLLKTAAKNKADFFLNELKENNILEEYLKMRSKK